MDLLDMPTIIYVPNLVKIKSFLTQWEKRLLTYIGKIAVIIT